MAYKAGMARFEKSGDGLYRPVQKGGFYKGGNGKMYKMGKSDYSAAGEGMDAKDNQPDDQKHIDSHEDDNTDVPGEKDRGGYKKSDISEDDFQKSLDELEALTLSDDVTSRKDSLLAKAQSSTLDTDEREELYKALGGGDSAVDDNPQFAEEITKSFVEPDDNLQKALDVSEYLEEHHSALTKSLEAVRDTMEKSDTRQHEYNLVLAKAVHQAGELIKGIGHRLGVIETQPARAPKSRGVGQPAHPATMEKSFSGQEPGGEQLSKSDILDTMEAMMQKSDPDGPGAMALLTATAQYEQTNEISKAMFEQVKDFRATNAH